MTHPKCEKHNAPSLSVLANCAKLRRSTVSGDWPAIGPSPTVWASDAGRLCVNGDVRCLCIYRTQLARMPYSIRISRKMLHFATKFDEFRPIAPRRYIVSRTSFPCRRLNKNFTSCSASTRNASDFRALILNVPTVLWTPNSRSHIYWNTMRSIFTPTEGKPYIHLGELILRRTRVETYIRPTHEASMCTTDWAKCGPFPKMVVMYCLSCIVTTYTLTNTTKVCAFAFIVVEGRSVYGCSGMRVLPQFPASSQNINPNRYLCHGQPATNAPGHTEKRAWTSARKRAG